MSRYMIAPDFTMQLAYQEAMIGAGHQFLIPAFPTLGLLLLLHQAGRRGEMFGSAARLGVGTIGKKVVDERY